MRVPLAVAQLPVCWDVGQNLARICAVLADAPEGEVVVLPEGAVSGYDDELSGLDRLDPATLHAALRQLAEIAVRRKLHVFCGSLLPGPDGWRNVAVHIAPDGVLSTYAKVNLATHERGRLAPGNELRPVAIDLMGGRAMAGIQLCRELLYPEQWLSLASSGAELFIYLTNAANPAQPPGVWRSHLISRAAANQRFVAAANVADARQHCPSMIISPRGEVVAELSGDHEGVLRATVDLAETSDWYLSQRRADLVDVSYGTAERELR